MDIVSKAAERFDSNPALVTEKNTLTFRALEAETSRMAAKLLQHGMGQERIAALCMPNSPELLLILLALLRNGSIAAPLNHRFPSSRLQEMLNRLKPASLIGPRNMTEQLSNSLKLDPETLIAESSSAKKLSKQFNTSTTQQFNSSTIQQFNNPISVIHTSSSSGNPKAAVHTLGNHYYSALGSNENIPFKPGDCWLLSLPLFHIGGYAMLFRSLLGGGALAVMEHSSSTQDALNRFELSHLSLVPTQLYRMLQNNDALKKLQGLKAILLGGSAVEPALLKEASKAGLPVYLTYGSTEMSSQITTTPGPVETMTAGRVLPYRQLSIGPGDEILVKGPCLFQGYLSERGPFLETDTDGWFHTGDTGALSPEGELAVTGRTDNMFISGGENIHPEEIERALCSLTEVKRAIVVPKTDPEFSFKPAAFIEAGNEAPSDTGITETLSGMIGKLKTPVEIHRVKEWHLLPGTEKIDRNYYKRVVSK